MTFIPLIWCTIEQYYMPYIKPLTYLLTSLSTSFVHSVGILKFFHLLTLHMILKINVLEKPPDLVCLLSELSSPPSKLPVIYLLIKYDP